VGWSEARAAAAAAASALPAETVPLDHAIGRVLAADAVALTDVPHFASAAMDGWAVSGPGPWLLGEHPAAELSPGRAVPIVTGGLVPRGTAAVLRSESGAVDGARSRLSAVPSTGEPRDGQHVRPAGEEARRGDVVLRAGTLLNPAHIAVAAGCGHDRLTVVGLPRVRLLLTGDEVDETGIPLPGRVRDSFGPQLPAVLALLGGAVVSKARVRDDLASLTAAIRQDASSSDLIVTTGGTGDSPVDHLHAALAAVGAESIVRRVAMRPGGPTTLARLADGRLLLGLPGNPLAAMMGLLSLGAPLLATLGGRPVPVLPLMPSARALEGRRGATLLVPFRREDGRAVPNEWVGSGMMRGLADSAGVLVVPATGIRAGDDAVVLPLPWA
jgi:molybdopterin molybdotransferase